MNFIKLTLSWKGYPPDHNMMILVNLNQVVQIVQCAETNGHHAGSILRTTQPPYVEDGDAEIYVTETPDQIMKSLGIITL